MIEGRLPGMRHIRQSTVEADTVKGTGRLSTLPNNMACLLPQSSLSVPELFFDPLSPLLAMHPYHQSFLIS